MLDSQSHVAGARLGYPDDVLAEQVLADSLGREGGREGGRGLAVGRTWTQAAKNWQEAEIKAFA